VSQAPVPGNLLVDPGYEQDERPTATVRTREARTAKAPSKERPAKRTSGKQAPARSKAAAQAAPAREARTRQAPARPQPAPKAPRQTSTRKPRKRKPGRVLALVGASAVLTGAAAIYLTKSGGGEDHSLSTPTALGAYVQNPKLAAQMQAKALQEQIVKEADGHATNVIYAVYEDSTGPAAASGSQVILFIGGNLSGSSAGSFISTFTGKLPGAVTTSPGSLGGEGACAPSTDGRPAACIWADNDTFGVFTSATLSVSALADEMRSMRPMLEHEVSKPH
jgi:hypothetical protein